MPVFLSQSSQMLSIVFGPTLQEVDKWGALPWYAWLLIFVVVVLFLWWRLWRAAKQFDEEVREFESQTAEHGQDEPEYEKLPEEDSGEQSEVEQSPAAGTADDLTKIEGIGPKISSLLAEAGITTYTQLADTQTGRLDEILGAAGLHMVNESTWPEQARLAAGGKWEELVELQEEL